MKDVRLDMTEPMDQIPPELRPHGARVRAELERCKKTKFRRPYPGRRYGTWRVPKTRIKRPELRQSVRVECVKCGVLAYWSIEDLAIHEPPMCVCEVSDE